MMHIDMLTRFVDETRETPNVHHTHVMLYAALWFRWKDNGFQQPFAIYRNGLMGRAGIRSTDTYHKCMSNLVELGYVTYEPSYDHHEGSKVMLLKTEELA